MKLKKTKEDSICYAICCYLYFPTIWGSKYVKNLYIKINKDKRFYDFAVFVFVIFKKYFSFYFRKNGWKSKKSLIKFLIANISVFKYVTYVTLSEFLSNKAWDTQLIQPTWYNVAARLIIIIILIVNSQQILGNEIDDRLFVQLLAPKFRKGYN